MTLSVIIPVLNEEAILEARLLQLADLRSRGAEVIVVDGGSEDRTVSLATALADSVLTAPRGRASQMNAGARVARGDILLFLHADTMLPHHADLLIEDALARTGSDWGYFSVGIAPSTPLLRMVAAAMNIRSRLSAIATGDQALFVRRRAFDAVDGYPAIALMEDIAISRALKHVGRPVCLRARVVTSARRWRKNGAIRTILLMWRLRLAYFLGADPHDLARRYGHAP